MINSLCNWRECRLILLASLLITSHPLAADTEFIELTDADRERLDLRFAPARSNTASDGFAVPARVINSPEQSSQIKSYFNGTLSRWIITSGDRVQPGAAIAWLSSPELMQQQQQWLAAQHHFTNVQQQLDKDRQLLADGVISEQRMQQTQREHRQAAFNLQGWRQQLQQAGVTYNDLQAVLNGQLNPGDYVMRAPLAGVASRRGFGVGDKVSADQIVATITNAADLWLQASVPTQLAQQLNIGDSLQVIGSPVLLTLTGKSQEVNSSTQRVAITARFNDVTTYLPGQQLSLVLPAQYSGIRIPSSAVTHTENTTFVYIRRSDGIEIRALQLQAMGSDYLAASGISDGEQLLVQGAAQLKGIQLGLGGGE